MKFILIINVILFGTVAFADQNYQEEAIKGLWHIGGRFERVTDLVYVDGSLILFACHRRIRHGFAAPVRCRKSRQLSYEPSNDRMLVVLDERYHIRVDPQFSDELYIGDLQSDKIILGHRVHEDFGSIRFDE